MNEKIRELMMQAGEYAKSVWVDPTEENYVSWHDLFNEKFVELIVRECIDSAFRNGDNIDYIKEHFGVE